MADPVSIAGIGMTAIGGVSKMMGAKTNADAQKINIQGQMLQTIGAAFAHKAQAQQYQYEANINKYQAAVSLLNRDISKQNAAYARTVGEVQAQQIGMKGAAERGELIASQGASGLSVAGASAGRVREGMIEVNYYDQMQARASAAKKAYGYEIEATMHEAQSDVYRYTATMNESQRDNEMTAAKITESSLGMQQQAMGLADKQANISMLGSLAGTAGSVADKWIQGGGLGMFGGTG